MNTKTKIYLILTVWLVFSVAMFLYGFQIMDKSNRQALAKISQDKVQMLQLKAQEDSYRLAQQDLDQMAKEQYQPQDFFSSDITLVKEIEALENLGKNLGVELTLGGITGTINTVPKAKTKSGELYYVPYSISVSGSFEKVTDFIETLENLDFITTLNSLSLTSSGSGDSVSASMSADFYIRKNAN